MEMANSTNISVCWSKSIGTTISWMDFMCILLSTTYFEPMFKIQVSEKKTSKKKRVRKKS